MDIILTKVLAYFVLLFSITIHEASHGWAAKKLGDPTAFQLGRVTLNPIPHIDPVGTVMLPLIMMFTGIPLIGWAKPVPVNPMNLRNPRKDNLWISAAGPISNFMAATGFVIILQILKFLSPKLLQAAFYSVPGQASQLQFAQGLGLILYFGILINIALGIFNLIPIPPLDGSGVLMRFLSDEAAEKYDKIRPYGIFIIFGLIFFRFFQIIFTPIQAFLQMLISM